MRRDDRAALGCPATLEEQPPLKLVGPGFPTMNQRNLADAIWN